MRPSPGSTPRCRRAAIQAPVDDHPSTARRIERKLNTIFGSITVSTPFDDDVSLDAYIRDIPREDGLRACRDAIAPGVDPRAEALAARIAPFLRDDVDRGEVLLALGRGLDAPAIDPWKARALDLLNVLYRIHADLGDRAGSPATLALDLAALHRLALDPAAGCSEETRSHIAGFLLQLPVYLGGDSPWSPATGHNLGFLALQFGQVRSATTARTAA